MPHTQSSVSHNWKLSWKLTFNFKGHYVVLDDYKNNNINEVIIQTQKYLFFSVTE